MLETVGPVDPLRSVAVYAETVCEPLVWPFTLPRETHLVSDSARAEHRRWEWSDLLVIWGKPERGMKTPFFFFTLEETSGAFHSTPKAEIFPSSRPSHVILHPEAGIFRDLTQTIAWRAVMCSYALTTPASATDASVSLVQLTNVNVIPSSEFRLPS